MDDSNDDDTVSSRLDDVPRSSTSLHLINNFSRPTSHCSIARGMYDDALRDDGQDDWVHGDADSLIAKFNKSRPQTGLYGDRDSNRPIHQIARDGDEVALEAVLRRLPPDKILAAVTDLDEDGMRPLHYAARYWHFGMAAALIAHGADPAARDEFQRTPLHLAAMYKKAPLAKQGSPKVQPRNGTDPVLGKAEKDQVSVICNTPAPGDQQNWDPESGAPQEESSDPPCPEEKRRQSSFELEDHVEPAVSKPNLRSSLHVLPPLDVAMLPLTPAKSLVKGSSFDAAFPSGLNSRNDALGMNGPEMFSQACVKLNSLGKTSKEQHTMQIEFERLTKQQQGPCMIRFFLERGLDINCRNFAQMTPLHLACRRGSSRIVKTLLECPGVDAMAEDSQGTQPLHGACMYGFIKIVKHLVDHNVDLRAKDKKGQTPLHKVAYDGHAEIVELLLQAGRTKFGEEYTFKMLDDADIDQSCPLHLAVERGNMQICEILIKHKAKLNHPKKSGATPLHEAAKIGNGALCELLLEAGADIRSTNKLSQTPLHIAAHSDKTECVKLFIEKGADKDATDAANCTPLLLSASTGKTKTIEELLRRGAAVDVVDKEERSVIFWAAKRGNAEALAVLLRHAVGAAMADRGDRRENAPLLAAAAGGHADAVELLLAHGARVDPKNDKEETPLHHAADKGYARVVEAILAADPTVVNDLDENGLSPLHWACYSNCWEVATMLLEAGAYVEARDPTVFTPLAMAAFFGKLETARILLNFGASVDSDGYKKTPLHHAAEGGHVKLIRLLLSRGADVSATNEEGYNALEIAVRNNHRKAAEAIMESSQWERALKNERISKRTRKRATPLRMMIKKMPEVAEIAFRRCVRTSQHSPEDKDFTITYDYTYLEDTSWALKSLNYLQNRCSCWTWPKKEAACASGGAAGTERGMKSHFGVTNQLSNDEEADPSVSCWGPKFMVERKVDCGHGVNVPEVNEASGNEATSSSTTNKLFEETRNSAKVIIDLKRNHPLSIMVRYSRTNLLNHPLSRALVSYKWRKFGRYIYYSNLGFYSIFLTFLTGYVLTTPAPVPVVTDEATGEFHFSETCPKEIAEEDEESLAREIFAKVGRRVIFVMAALNLAREIFQLFHRNFLLYFDFENALEWICYITALVFVTDFTVCSSKTGLREPWQWQVGAVAIFLAWLNLLLFIKKFPFFGIYVVMFTDIFRTFSKFFLVFFFFVVGFALAFHVLLQQQVMFKTPGEAMVKTFVMMIGEMDFEDIFYDSPERKVYYPGLTYCLFIGFLLVMSIIIMNLLVGLAVDDIKSVQDHAALERLAMQVRMVIEVETMLPSWIRQRCIATTETVAPNANKGSGDPGVIGEFLADCSDAANSLGGGKTEEDAEEAQQSDARKLAEKFEGLKAESKDSFDSLKSQMASLADQNRIMSEMLEKLSAKIGNNFNLKKGRRGED